MNADTNVGLVNEDRRTFWCAEPDPKKFAHRLRYRIDAYRKWLETTGRAQRIRRMWNCVTGFTPDGAGNTSALLPAGGQGELLEMSTNEVATLVRQTTSMLLKDKPAAKAIARNSDVDSLAQTLFADGLLEYNETHRSWGARDRDLLNLAIITTEAWLIDSWERFMGQQDGEDLDTGAPEYQGDIGTIVGGPFDVTYDPKTSDDEALQWFAFRKRYNRFDLAVRFPKCKAWLDAYEPSQDSQDGWSREADWELQRYGETTSETTDLIWVWEARILPCPALPEGRLVRVVHPDCVLTDSFGAGKQAKVSVARGDDQSDQPEAKRGVYPYMNQGNARLHAYQLRPVALPGTLAGFSDHQDLVGLQEGLDICTTAVISVVNQGAIANIYAGPESNYQENMGGGFRIWEGPTEPKMMASAELSPAVVPALELIRALMKARAGSNQVIGGETPKGMPGNAMALLYTQALQYVNELAQGMTKVFSDSRTGRIYLYKEFATDERVAQIAGEGNTWSMTKWTGPGNLSDVERVGVEEIPAALRTEAGRQQAVEFLVANGLITNKQEVLTLWATGQDKPMWKGDQMNLLRIRQEVELLRKGIGLPPVKMNPDGSPIVGQGGLPVFVDPPPVPGQLPPPFIRPTLFDSPWYEIPEYMTVIASPTARANPQVFKATTEAITIKEAMWSMMPPQRQAMLGCPPDRIRLPMPPPGAVGSDGKPAQPPAAPQAPHAGPPGAQIQQPKPPADPTSGSKAPVTQTSQPGTAGPGVAA